MKIISFDQIRDLNISPKQCYEWVEEVIFNKRKMLLPAKISLKPDIPNVFYNTMPCILPEAGWAGVKLVTRYPMRVPSLDSEILLYDLYSGENLALLDGNWITAMRTGAVAAHSVKVFAIPDYSEVGFIGLGNTARATLRVLLALEPERNFTIKLKKYKNQHELFAELFVGFNNVKFVFCDTFEEVVRNSDVVVSAATVFEEDICSDDCFKEGVLVIPIHTRGFTNCDLFFDKVYADDINHVKGFKYFDQYRFFAEVTDVINQKTVGRENNNERIIVYNIGIAIHDMYYAGKIYDMCKDKGVDVSLNAPDEKFWV